jgi:soluble P-type ATPase
MIQISIPNTKTYSFEHLVLDLNGTLSCDGDLIPGVEDQLIGLSNKINIHILTADTFGQGMAQTKDINCFTKILQTNNQSLEKQDYVISLDSSKCVCIGNGYNDHLMVKVAVVGIAVIQCEGAAVQTILNADIACPDIKTALDLLIFPKRLIATLRN